MMFQKPELEIVIFKDEDIIFTSSHCDGDPSDLHDLYGSGCNYDGT